MRFRGPRPLESDDPYSPSQGDKAAPPVRIEGYSAPSPKLRAAGEQNNPHCL
jgi:hypothetical protein